MAPMSGGCGASLAARPFAGRDLERILLKYVDAWLGALALSSKDAAEKVEHANGISILAELFGKHSASGKYLTRAFGQEFAARYAVLLWNE